jgi:hypothetical protein
MKERSAYVGGEWVPEGAAKVSVHDRGVDLERDVLAQGSARGGDA